MISTTPLPDALFCTMNMLDVELPLMVAPQLSDSHPGLNTESPGAIRPNRSNEVAES
jgi:hypothetical protein